MQFKSEVTPNPAALFSPLIFGQGIDLKTYAPIDSATVFINPIRHIVAIYSYDNMVAGTQWTALWYRDGKLVYYETKPWDGSTGGLGSTERIAAPDEWLPGEYEVQIFVGMEWKSVGRFVVQGISDTSTPTRAPAATQTNTPTHRPSPTATITKTIPPTWTLAPSRTLLPTMTRVPTRARPPTDTPWPSLTPSPTRTR
jgi:type VI secretion system secreted protein VgrG